MTANTGWYEKILLLSPDETKQSAYGKGKDDTAADAAFSAAAKLEKLNCVTDTLYIKELISIMLVVFDVKISSKIKKTLILVSKGSLFELFKRGVWATKRWNL